MADEALTTSATGQPTADEGARCPQCGYNLTGLPEPRCPECGTAFDWAAVRRAAANPPQIFFERVRGWRKVPGFFVTWATVLFAPWIFARQAVKRISAWHAIVFALVCFGGTFVAMPVGNADMQFMATWLTTALAYLLIQAVVDWSEWRQPLRALRFWLFSGLYLSAVMPTEVVHGPPPLFARDFYRFLSEGLRPSFVNDMYDLSIESMIYWGQLVIWLVGIGCCYYARLRRQRWSIGVVLPATLLVMSGTLALYAAAVEYIGDFFAHLYGK